MTDPTAKIRIAAWRDAVKIVAALDGIEYHAVFELLPKRRMLSLKTLWKGGRPPVIRP